MFLKLRLNLALKTALLWVVGGRFGFVVGRFGSFWVVPRFSNYATFLPIPVSEVPCLLAPRL